MSNPVIQVENVGKLYRLGEVGTGTLSKDLNRWWAKLRGKEDPYSRIGQSNDRTRKGLGGDVVWALQDLTFDVNRGDVVGIIGKNGAGKSTLLKIISQITTPSTGTIKVKGRVASLLEVGTGFHPEMTGRDNIFMNGTLLGMSRREIQNKLDDIVEFAGVALYLDTPVKRYSSGMQVRLAFAVAAFLEPEILIVDEVLAVGDAEFQKKAIGRMQEVSKGGGRTVLFVSHNIQAIRKLCSVTALLNNGRLTKIGRTNDVIESYLGQENVSVSEFILSDGDDSKAVTVSRLLIEDLNGKSFKEIPVGKAWRVRVFFKVNTKVANVVVGLGMVDSYESAVRTTWNLPHDFEPGEYVATFIEDKIKFSSGRYKLLVGISSGSEVIQYIDKDLWFVVSDVVEDDDGARIIDSFNGIILNQMTTSIERID